MRKTLFTEERRRSLKEAAGPFSALVSEYRAKGWKIWIDPEGEDRWELSEIVVPKESRGMGEGSAFMKKLTKIADQHAITITCTPSKDFGASSVARLKSFYKAHGFVENKGRNKDYRTSRTMYRPPR